MSKRLTMSNKMRRIFFGFLILLTGMAFAGCSNSSFESPETPQTGTGYFVLTNGTGADTETFRAQTITPTPAVNDFALYKLFFTGTGGNSNTQDVDRTPATLNNPVELPVGTWELEVFAYKTGSDDQPTAQGSFAGVIDIKNGGTTSGDVTLTTFVPGGTGTFNWTISYPANVNAVMTIMDLYESPVEPQFSIASGASDYRTLDSGYYYIVLVELTNTITNQTAKRRETLYIHNGLTSTFTHTFTAANFFTTLSATVDIDLQTTGTPIPPWMGEKLVATVLPAGTYNYQWYKNDNLISGAANSDTYTLTTGDEGGPNTFFVIVTRDGYNGSIKSNILSETFQHTVTFNINTGSGTTPAAKYANYGSAMTLPDGTGFSKTGYDFGGWNTLDTGAGTNYSSGASYTPTGGITLFAKWTAKTVAITLNNNGGVNGSTTLISGNYGETVTNLPSSSPAIPTRDGYTFAGWSKESGTTNTVNFNSSTELNEANNVANATTSPTLTLYAVWTAKTVAITLNNNGGSGSVTSISGKVYDGTIGTDLPEGSSPSIPTRSDHMFMGWSTSSTANTVNFTSTIVINTTNGVQNAGTSPTLTLYAVWKSTPKFTIDFATITDQAPTISGEPIPTPTISLSGTGGNSTTATLTVDNPTAYTDFKWFIDIEGPDDIAASTSSSITLDATDDTYNAVGDHYLTLELKKGTIQYSKIIIFTVIY